LSTKPFKGKVCILGGTGFIGRRLAARLGPEGYDLVIPTRSRQRNRELLVLPSVDLVDANIHDSETLGQLIADCDVVVNLVGVLNDSRQSKYGFQGAHVELVKTLVSACQQQGVTRLLHMSSLKANAERGPSDYLRSKGQGEAVLKTQGQDLAWTIFQPSVVFGPNDDFTNRFANLLKIAPLFPLARPNARFAPVYVEDVVEAFVLALRDPSTAQQTFELCGPQIYSLREITEFISKVLGLQRVTLGLPDSLSKIQAWFCEWLPGKPFSRDNFRSLTVNSICSESGFAKLKVKPRPMEVIVPRYLRAQNQGQLLDDLRQTAGR
jgi:uncharacterized protein YbjT (DUF2867 family)